MTDQGKKKEPIHKIQRGSIEAAVWENVRQAERNGRYSVHLSTLQDRPGRVSRSEQLRPGRPRSGFARCRTRRGVA